MLRMPANLADKTLVVNALRKECMTAPLTKQKIQKTFQDDPCTLHIAMFLLENRHLDDYSMLPVVTTYEL